MTTEQIHAETRGAKPLRLMRAHGPIRSDRGHGLSRPGVGEDAAAMAPTSGLAVADRSTGVPRSPARSVHDLLQPAPDFEPEDSRR